MLRRWLAAARHSDTNAPLLPPNIGARVSSIGRLPPATTIRQQRAIHRRGVVTEQLHSVLNSRVLIEQAKGVLAERLNVPVHDAFTVLRTNARSRNRRLSELAQAIGDGSEQVPAVHIPAERQRT
jgi:hypothetical protein